MKKYKRQLWLGAALTLSALILGGQGLVSSPKASALNASPAEIEQNIKASPRPLKIRIFGALLFSASILTAIIVVSSEIKTARPPKEKILRKYYRP